MVDMEKIKLELKVTNQYGDEFGCYDNSELESGFETELEHYLRIYKNFLVQVGFDYLANKKLIAVKEDEE